MVPEVTEIGFPFPNGTRKAFQAIPDLCLQAEAFSFLNPL